MPADERLALEDRGLALTTTALRFAYSYGGDGESNVKVRHQAGAQRGTPRVAAMRSVRTAAPWAASCTF